MFQTAGTLRAFEVYGRPFGMGSEKFSTPCCCGVAPVAMVVQTTGEKVGWKVSRPPPTPRSIMALKCGMRPASSSGIITSHSMPSIPITKTGGRSEAEGSS